MSDHPDDYPIVLFWSDEDDAWIADVPDLAFCSAHGDSPEEALREIQIAKRVWLEVARREGRSLPSPSDVRTRLLASA
jgi:predicted RNase H-like HicB family nuclease